LKAGFWKTGDLSGQTLPMIVQRNYSLCTREKPKFVRISDESIGRARERKDNRYASMREKTGTNGSVVYLKAKNSLFKVSTLNFTNIYTYHRFVILKN
jgi:hypothetical protein